MEEKENLLFSFSSLNKEEKKIEPSELINTVTDGIITILNKEFSERGKRQIKIHQDRIQFACPYCRDSATDHYKKRGNFYKADMNYHCYNCGVHTSGLNLLQDFGITIDNDSMISLHNISSTAKKEFQLQVGNLSDLYIFDSFTKYAQDLKSYKILYNLKDIKDSGYMIKDYLQKRDQYNWDHMAWDGNSKQLYIFNMVDETRFIAFQTRQFDKYSKQKYLTYNLNHIYDQMFLPIPDDPDFIEANKLSTFFGLFTVDFNRPISVFEGPLDSLLRKNSVATCSVHKEFPIDIPVQWFFDYDEAGNQKAVEKIKAGEEVFLWSKFIKDMGLKINKNKKIDYNDLYSYMKNNKYALNSLYNSEFFSSSHYDIYEI